ncbi:MAG: CIA30 family protein [Sulfurospirillaceae bacterium]|nr:CIA30 family protein [Sulfurospirillaceae bacterium]MDD3463739.1 CIA30 family protein [Sulfurospirillaceae bacterium]
MNTYLDDKEAIVSDIRGMEITFKLKNSIFKPEQKVKIYVPKKSIAIVDFEVIRGSADGIERVSMENMTSKFVQSGQYVVIERNKLQGIMEEQKLIELGIINEGNAIKLGKLVSADLILTGTLAKNKKDWDINLRIIDVATGVILSAVREKAALEEFRVELPRDNANISENFENGLKNGWSAFAKTSDGAKASVRIDEKIGANLSQKSLRMDYEFLGEQRASASISNDKSRDISSYRGAEFHVKSTQDTTLVFSLNDQNYDNANSNKWYVFVNSSPKWQKIKINFSDLALGKNYTKAYPGGDGKLDLDRVYQIEFQVRSKDNNHGKEKQILWLDEVRFY